MKLTDLKIFVNNKDKIPFVNGHYIKWSDSGNWLTYEQAQKNAKSQGLGISIVLGKISDTYTLAGIDYDTIRDVDKKLLDENVKNDINNFKCKHLSISGYGVHVLCLIKNDFKLTNGNRTHIKSNLNIIRYDEKGIKKEPEIEFYNGARTFAIPNNIDLSKFDLVDETNLFSNLYYKYLGNKKRYTTSNNNKEKNDESRKDFKIVADMVKKGYSKEQIQKEFITSDYALSKDDKHKDKLFKRDDYLERTIDNAVDIINEESNDNNSKLNDILKLLDKNILFIDERKVPHIIVDYVNVKIESKMFEEIVEGLCFDNKINIGNQTITKLQKYLCNKARKKGYEVELSVRFGGNDEEIYYQLSEEKLVKIDGKKYEVIDNDSPMFRWHKNMLKQTLPQRSNANHLKDIFEFINIDKEQKLIFMVYLISLFIPNIPKPILVLSAERGSGKTTATKLIKSLVDPSLLETTKLPYNEVDLSQVLDHSALINFDNISNISHKQSDILCRAYSGEAIMTRQLYSNDDEFILKYKRAIIINGIDCPINKSDLMDRTIIIDLKRIVPTARRTESSIYKQWEEKKPQLLHNIFEVISKSIQIHSNTKLDELQRFADWQEWGYAIAEAIQTNLGTKFLQDISKVVARQNEEVIDNNVYIQVVMQFMSDKGVWKGTTKELCDSLKLLESTYDTRTFSTPSVLSKRLKEQKSIFESQGLMINTGIVGTNNKRYIEIVNTKY